MDELHKQVRRAYLRMGGRRFAGVLGWCWFAALSIALVLIAVNRFYPLAVADWQWLVGGLGIGLVAAVIWTLVTRRDRLTAAIEIDRRFGLKERVASSLNLPPEQRDTEIGQALIHDAVRRVERIEVSQQFGLTPPRSFLLPLIPALLAVLVVLFVSPAVVENPAQAKANDPAIRKQVKRSTEELRRRMQQRREEAKKQGLKDAERLFKRLEDGTKDLMAKPADRKQAMVKLNDLARDLKQRREALGGAEQMRKQLDQLKQLQNGPAEKFAKAIAQGDFRQAAKEIDELKKKLDAEGLDNEQKEKLAEQLDEIKQKLEEMADARDAAMDELQKQAEQFRQAGNLPEASKLEEQLSKLMQQGPQMKQLQQLAQQMGQCANCLREGQMQNAQDLMQQLQAGMGDMQKQLDELQMLDDAMQQLADAKARMSCPECNGAGCQACQGKPGQGLGAGRGAGARPEAETDTAFYDSQVKQKMGQGAADVVDLVDGPNVRGKVEQQLKDQVQSAREGTTDPLTGKRIPRKHRQHAQEYFDRFRQGE